MIGSRFGRLIVIDLLPKKVTDRKSYAMARVRCDCGVVREVFAENLRAGRTTSCGCWRARTAAIAGNPLERKSPEYRAWANMKDRCENPRHRRYLDWGGRGIRVCERWRAFANFLADMGRRPSADHSLDRINNDGNYEPGNVRWATSSEQAQNRKRAA